MLLPQKEPRLSSVARLATERRSISALDWSTRMVLSEIFPRMNASPAAKTAAVEATNPGLAEITRKLATPNTMPVARAVRTDVRSMYHPASGAQTDWAMT